MKTVKKKRSVVRKTRKAAANDYKFGYDTGAIAGNHIVQYIIKQSKEVKGSIKDKDVLSGLRDGITDTVWYWMTYNNVL